MTPRQFAIISTALLLTIGCKENNDFDGLKLVAKYKPLNLSIYADITATNKYPDVVVRERDDPLYMRETESNEIKIVHFERYNQVLVSEYDLNWALRRRTVWFYEKETRTQTFSYVDTNGDGLFDFLIEGNGESNIFTQSNMCWLPARR
jgi:hypothetical protein